MLFCAITRPELIQRIPDKSVGVELRLDLFPQIDFAFIKEFLKTASVPVMLTVRKTSQGGKFRGTEAEREALIEQLLALRPPFFDLEYDMDPKFLQKMLQKHPDTKFVISFHYFQKIPDDLEAVYCQMSRYAAFSYKIAVFVSSANEALKMLLFARKHPKISVICMGEKGEFARVLGAVAGNLVDYASIDALEQTGPGQLSVSDLCDIYRYPSLNGETAVYGLIGDPVGKSPGHLYHNAVFRERGLNAVYVKMSVKLEELEDFVSLAKAFGIRGLSVTIPLKEAILPFVDQVESSAKPIGAVNTLLFKEDRIFGTNTDGLGALDAIEAHESVQGKKVVLLGAGGAARAIAFEAKARGSDVLILNRTVERAKILAIELGCKGAGLDAVPDHYDVLINCSSEAMPIDASQIVPKTIAMDVGYFPKETLFLKAALAKHCRVVYGEEMFVNQAARQTAFWIGER